MIANVLSIILFNLLASFPYSQLLTVHAYLSGASVSVSPEWQITKNYFYLPWLLYLYLNNQLEILSGSRWGYKYLYLNLHAIVFEGYSASYLKAKLLSYKGGLAVLSRCPHDLEWTVLFLCLKKASV